MTANKGHNRHLSKRNVGQDGTSSYRAFPSGLLLVVVLALVNALLLTPAGSLPRVVGALALLLLPGLVWTERLFPTADRLTRWAVGTGLSYTLVMILGLILYHLPGPIPLWTQLVTLNALILVPWLKIRDRRLETSCPLGIGDWRPAARNLGLRDGHWLLFILALAALFRFGSLGYSEFQGDEALAMISAAEALEGHQDALFLRGKGPGEVLLPMALWRLTGTINETIARLPFTISGLLTVLTIYLLGRRLFSAHTFSWGNGEGHRGEHAGLVAAGLLALNGFMVGFSRIVQYQALVVWMSGLALLCSWEWRARIGTGPLTQPGMRWAALAGAFLGTGLLAHYDAILVVPAIAYIGWTGLRRPSPSPGPRGAARPDSLQRPVLRSLLVTIFSFLIVSGLFFLPYILDPQAGRTGGYLGDRIGNTLLKNNLDSFLHFSIFYNSFYYVMFTGLLVLGFLAWALRRAPGVQHVPGGRYWVPALAVIVVLGLALQPDALRIASLDLAPLAFALILLGVFMSPILDPGQRAAVIWMAVPFLGYNFAVALPLTHIYTTIPAWTLLAGLAIARLWQQIPNPQYPKGTLSLVSKLKALLFVVCPLLLIPLFGGYLYTAYLRHEVEFWQDWPDSQPALYWSPYHDLPSTGFFGFVHRSGWKEVGDLYAKGILNGDYGSNEEPEVTTWYTRGAPRACDPQPEYYLIADDLVDPWPVDMDIIEMSYAAIGQITLPNSKELTLYQARPPTTDPGRIDTDATARAFDRTATPAAFARSARGSQPADANLGDLVRLIGYDVDTRRAWPGGRVAVTLYWQAQVPISDDYHVFVHLEGDGETGSTPVIWGQADGRPVCWTYPSFDWRPGQIIADQHAISVRPDTPQGEFPLLAGMYLPDTGDRLDVLDEAGEPVGNYVELTRVSIR